MDERKMIYLEDAIKAVCDEFTTVYCYNCANQESEDQCEWCHRKSMNWSVSRNTVKRILNNLPSAQPELITVNIDHELTQEEYEKLRKDMANAPVMLLPPEQRWIPCSERLPEEPYGCLVTVWDTNPVTMDEFENILPYFVGWDGEQWNDDDGEQCPFEVIAWMPLPKPYKGEES